MQTFVPCSTFPECASVLDRARLGKQRVEVLQILNALAGSGGWQNHPAVKMWRGHANTLAVYGVMVCDEWIRRGYKDTCREKIRAHLTADRPILPSWWNGPIHATHRAALLFKDPAHYAQFGWTEEPHIDYHWPTR